MSSEKSEEDLVKWLLSKLYRHGYWGGRHTSIDNLPKGTHPRYHPTIVNIAKNLIKDDLLLSKRKPDGLHVSLNPRKKRDIEEMIRGFLNPDGGLKMPILKCGKCGHEMSYDLKMKINIDKGEIPISMVTFNVICGKCKTLLMHTVYPTQIAKIIKVEEKRE